MELSAYENLAIQEETHWYYLFRKQILSELINQFFSVSPGKILDIGAGTGGTTRLLCGKGEVFALEPSKEALVHLQKKVPDIKAIEDIAENLDRYQLPQLDLITIICVLYHRKVKSPEEVIKKCSKIQNLGGILIWQEPTYNELKRKLDDKVHGVRRFLPSEMSKILESYGYQVLEEIPVLAWAYPFAYLAKFFESRGEFSKDSKLSFEHLRIPRFFQSILMLISIIDWRLQRLFLKRFSRGISTVFVAKKVR